jgi:hypothetical protein
MSGKPNTGSNGADDAASLGAGLAGALAAAGRAAQTDAVVTCMGDMVREASHLANKAPEFLKGDLFEYIEVAKFNADAAVRDPSLVAKLTRELGDPHAAADILITRHGHVVREAQAKASRGTEELTRYLRHSKYHGMQKVVPVDKVGQVQQRAEFRARSWARRGEEGLARENLDTAQNVTGELHHDGVTSGGTTNAEAELAASSPRLYRVQLEAQYVAREVAVAAGTGAAAGAVVGGALAIAKNGWMVARGERDLGDAAVDVATSTVQASARGAVLARTLVCTGVRTLRSSWARARSRASALST